MARIPLSTYRLQLSPEFGFAQAADLVDYLDALGITDVYASPLLTARPGSTHGYDVVDHSRVNPELGSAADLARFSAEFGNRRMGLLLDVVPNHMCVDTRYNAWWKDVLENGPSSEYADYFDIDWNPTKLDLTDKVLLPVLGDQYGRVLEAGQLKVSYGNGAFWLQVYDLLLPLAPESFPHLLEPALRALEERHGDALPGVEFLKSILTAIRHLPPRGERDPEKVEERRREKEIIKARIAALVDSDETVREAAFAEIESINGRAGKAESFDRLDALLADQAYRVAYWQVASEEINYRRFFDINELAAIRVENPAVFDDVHRVIFDLVRNGPVTGLRIDHVDGLFDPMGYLTSLQASCCGDGEMDPARGGADSTPGFYVVVEKILAEGERLPAEWPVYGTTGYDFLNLLGGMLLDRRGARKILVSYERLMGGVRNFSDVAYECEKEVLRRVLASQVAMLARRLDRISEQHRHSRDFTQQDLQDALVEVLACMPVYRTYLRPDDDSLGDADRRWVERAVEEAKRRNRAMSASIFDFVRSVLVLDHPEGLGKREREERREFVLRLQQLSGAIMAKAVEDTAFYRYYPLASRAEVGGTPDRPGVDLEAFHRSNQERLRHFPHALLATSTHDTKRGEDARARIRVLSELPDTWLNAFRRFRKLNRPHRSRLPEGEAPDVNEEYLLYQTLIGIWPFEPLDGEGRGRLLERVQAYMQKALREAKVHSSWVNPNPAWENAVARFIDRILQPESGDAFLSAFLALQRPVARAAVTGSLAQTLLKIASPGVPDFYQGSELWDFNLVDPDNRRPVDFAARRSMLAGLQAEPEGESAALAGRLLREPGDGQIKLWVAYRALGFRRLHRELFERGKYVGLRAEGPRAEHVISFARILGDRAVIAAAVRRVAKLHEPDLAPVGERVLAAVASAGRRVAKRGPSVPPPLGERIWDDTHIALGDGLPAGEYRDALTGVRHAVDPGRPVLLAGDVFAHLPVALLERLC
jgi:(1->4)-alpha-D-glucan 1-alpha-D-glucosylmutase